MSWPDAVALIGLLLFVMFLVGIGTSTWVEFRKTKAGTAQNDAMRQLVGRYEQLAEKTVDAQQRFAADISELRTRATSIEQILRTVD